MPRPYVLPTSCQNTKEDGHESARPHGGITVYPMAKLYKIQSAMTATNRKQLSVVF